MIQGVRRPEELSKLDLSNRLKIRVGALLKKNATISASVLELAKPGSSLESLLLEPAILEQAGTLETAALKALIAQLKDSTLNDLAAAPAGDGVRVICLQEELDAGEGWSNA